MKIRLRRFKIKSYFRFVGGILVIFGCFFPLVLVACWLLSIPVMYAYKVSAIVTAFSVLSTFFE